MDAMVDAYLTWKFPSPQANAQVPGDQTGDVASAGTSDVPASPGLPTAPSPPAAGDQQPPAAAGPAMSSTSTADTTNTPNLAQDRSLDITIDVLDIYTLTIKKTFARGDHQRTPVAIAESGYVAVSPISPSLAISFKTLELFHRLRRRKPSYSIEAFTKTICDLYGVI